MSDIYKAPEATLTGEDAEGKGDFGSIEKGLAGDYDASIGSIISEAWSLTKGNKGTIWLGLILFVVAYLAIAYVAGVITGYDPFDLEAAASAGYSASSLLHQLIVTVAIAPLSAGLMMIGVKAARQEQVSPTEVFAHFDKMLPLVLGTVLVNILVGLGFLLLILPGVYLAVSYMLAIPVIADKGVGAWKAMEISRKGLTKHWFSIFGLLIVLLLIYIVAALPLLIGLIWAIPLALITIGVLYRRAFGAGPEEAGEAAVA